MKIYIGKYRHRWVSYVHDRYMDKKHGRGWEESSTRFESFLEKIEDGLQWLYNHTINRILDKRSGRKIKVRIDPEDTWSMDHTLAPIIVPMLKQLKESKHGSPMVDMKDVPKELRATKKQLDACAVTGDVDPYFFDRWNWVMDEMIWAFEQKCRDGWESDYYEYENDPTKTEGLGLGLKLVWEDPEGREAHQKRMTNGFRLFGKYYENLWD